MELIITKVWKPHDYDLELVWKNDKTDGMWRLPVTLNCSSIPHGQSERVLQVLFSLEQRCHSSQYPGVWEESGYRMWTTLHTEKACGDSWWV